MVIKIKKGLDLPIEGTPKQVIGPKGFPSRFGIIGEDYEMTMPTMLVQVGDEVKKGQALFADKKCPEIKFTSPNSGKVVEINRGERRVFESIVIESNEKQEEVTFKNYSKDDFPVLKKEQIILLLLESGLWTTLKTRPYSKIPNPESSPAHIFVTAIDTHPLAPMPNIVISQRPKEFEAGLKILAKLTSGHLYLCKKAGTPLPGEHLNILTKAEFSGPHPAGLPGTHIHFLSPVNQTKQVWYINYQEVIAIGHLFTTGKMLTEKIVSIAGPLVKNPRLVTTHFGASLDELLENELQDDNKRVVSGSVFGGRNGINSFNYLGRFHNQVTVIKEGHEREFMGWVSPGINKFSIKNTFLSKLFPKKQFSFHSAENGDLRAIVPVGSYEKVIPFETEPSVLLRSLLCMDTEKAEQLGALDLGEEDMSLASFVCPSKIEYAPLLKAALEQIEKEG